MQEATGQQSFRYFRVRALYTRGYWGSRLSTYTKIYRGRSSKLGINPIRPQLHRHYRVSVSPRVRALYTRTSPNARGYWAIIFFADSADSLVPGYQNSDSTRLNPTSTLCPLCPPFPPELIMHARLSTLTILITKCSI